MTDLDIYSIQQRLEAIKEVDECGNESWSARNLMPPLGYGADWRNFSDTVDRARAACRNSGFNPADHFGETTKMVPIGSGAQRGVPDVRLSRYAAYLTALNGDSRKSEVAAAQTYFAARAREAELAAVTPALPAASAVSLPNRRELALMVVEAEDRADAAEALAASRGQELAIAAPKAESWDVLASAEGDWSVADAAKTLSRDPNIKVGQQRLFNYLGEIGWLFRARGDQRWRVMQSQVETGRLSELPSSHYHPRTGELVLDPPQVRITTKGMQELHRRLGGGPLSISA